MNVSKPLLEEINLSFQDKEWVKILDYEHIPFRCHHCHEYGNLFGYFPHAPSPNSPPSSSQQTQDGFTIVRRKSKGALKATITNPSREANASNQFAALEDLEMDME